MKLVNSSEIDVSELNSDLYFIALITSKDQVVNKQFIKN